MARKVVGEEQTIAEKTMRQELLLETVSSEKAWQGVMLEQANWMWKGRKATAYSVKGINSVIMFSFLWSPFFTEAQ